MRTLFIAIAVWNTVVAAINLFLLPLFMSPQALIYMTTASQALPIIIPLVLASFLPDNKLPSLRSLIGESQQPSW